MGLDMHAFVLSKQNAAQLPEPLPNDAIDVPRYDEGSSKTKWEEFFYWRKFNALHGWMERLYNKRGGEDMFNLVAIRLTEADLIDLEEDVAAGNLRPVPGFFFGQQVLDPCDMASIPEFIRKAREHLAEGSIVVYDSSW